MQDSCTSEAFWSFLLGWLQVCTSYRGLLARSARVASITFDFTFATAIACSPQRFCIRRVAIRIRRLRRHTVCLACPPPSLPCGTTHTPQPRGPRLASTLVSLRRSISSGFEDVRKSPSMRTQTYWNPVRVCETPD